MSSPRLSAIVRGIPDSLTRAITSRTSEEQDKSPINVQLAREQHARYVKALQRHCDHVIELEAVDAYPDCVFVEDPLVVIGQRALLNCTGAPSRRGEIAAFETAFASGRSVLKDLQVFDMNLLDPQARLEGGDVMYVPDSEHIFVGLSSRTNEHGLEVLKQIFGQDGARRVIPIHVKQGLHLKTFVTFAAARKGEAYITVGDCEIGRDIVRQMQESLQGEKDKEHSYHFVYIPDVDMANVVSLPISRGRHYVLLCRNSEGNRFRRSREALVDFARSMTSKSCRIELEWINNTETPKANGCLTCCSVIVTHTANSLSS